MEEALIATGKKTKTSDPLLYLTAKQRSYVEHRAAGKSPRDAIKLVCPDRSVSTHELTRDWEELPKVRAALAAINREALQKMVVTREDVIAGLMDATRAAATATELVMAWREIGKIIGAYEPVKLVVEHDVYTPETLATLTDAQLAQIAGLEGLTIGSLTIDGEQSGLEEGC